MKRIAAPLAGFLGVAAIITVNAIAIGAWAGESGTHHGHHGHMPAAGMAMDSDSTAHPQRMMAQETQRSIVNYKLPKIMLVRDDGQHVLLADELNDGRPVVMNFIFTSCTTVCPVSSRIFSVFQDGLGSELDRVHIVSISIDPEHDTPSVLEEYADEYDAGPEWDFYTGTEAASIAAQHAFDVYRGDRMNHTPVTLMRAAPGKPWLRIEGFATAGELLHDYHALIATK